MRRGLLAILLLAAIIPSLSRLIDDLRTAARMLPLSWEQRREALMPGVYANIETLRRQIPARETIAAIATSRQEIDQAVFVNYYVFPRHVKIYGSRWAYIATNPSDRPKIIIRPADARITTYAEERDEELRRSRVVQDLALPAEGRNRFIIPVVSSSDGMPPAAYTVEGALASDGEAHIRLTLWPAGIVRVLTVRGTRTFYDLVYESFGVMEFAAWVEVDSDRPLRAAFWFVNRIARTAAPIRLIDGPLRAPIPFPDLPPPVRLWLLNPSGSFVIAHAGSHPALVPARTLMAINATGTVSGPVYAFLSAKMPDGSTRFTWPEDVR